MIKLWIGNCWICTEEMQTRAWAFPKSESMGICKQCWITKVPANEAPMIYLTIKRMIAELSTLDNQEDMKERMVAIQEQLFSKFSNHLEEGED